MSPRPAPSSCSASHGRPPASGSPYGRPRRKIRCFLTSSSESAADEGSMSQSTSGFTTASPSPTSPVARAAERVEVRLRAAEEHDQGVHGIVLLRAELPVLLGGIAELAGPLVVVHPHHELAREALELRGRQAERLEAPVRDRDLQVPGLVVVDKVTKAAHEQEVTLDRDEGSRPDTTLAGLAKLNPVYPGGTTTAGNASQLSDGAGAVVMMDADLASRRGLPILGLFRGMQLAGVAPEEMSIAIAPAIRKVLKHHQLAMSDVDLWELHEAYAVTTLYNQAQLETPWEITNVNGGAVPLGHPYGMSGIRYLGSTLLELGRRKKRRAVVGVCTAGGMATAAFLERP